MRRAPVAWLAAPLVVGLAAGVAAPVAAQRRAIDVPAGALGPAAAELARQAGINIVLADPALWDRRVPAIRRRLDVEAAVRLLARAAGVAAARLGATGWRLSARPRRAPRATRAVPAPAADRPDDLVVQASKRNVPARLLAGSAEVMIAPPVGIDAGTAALVAGTTIISSTFRGAGREKLFIRGLADSSFSGRLQSVTGMYFGDVRLTYSAADPNLQLYDLASVEVLQGPQGTLYGSGSLAGVVRLNPRMPLRGRWQGAAGGGVSTVARGATGGDADAVVNVPLTGDLSLRAVGYVRSEGGYIDKSGRADVNRVHVVGGRAMLRWWPVEGWTVDAIGMAQAIRNRDAQYATIGAPPLTDIGTVAEPSRADYAAAQLVLNGRLGDLALVSATGVSTQRFRERFALMAAPPASIVADVRRRQALVTHETRVSHDGPVGWTAGIVYTGSAQEAALARLDDGRPLSASVDDTVRNMAVFGEGMVRVAPFLSLGGGARVEQAISAVRSAASLPDEVPSVLPWRRRRERWLLPTASLLLRPVDAWSLYARYQEGRRPSVQPALLAEDPPETRGERTRTWDFGGRWTMRGWQAAASLQLSRWRRLQVDAFEGFFGNDGWTRGDWQVTSAHAALNGPVTDALRIDAAVTVNHARRLDTEFGPSDQRLPDVAGVIARVGASWARRIGRSSLLRLDGWARYEGKSAAVFGSYTQGFQGDFVQTAATARWDRGAGSVILGIDNLLNVRADRYLFGNLLRFEQTTTPLRPRVVRIGYRRRF